MDRTDAWRGHIGIAKPGVLASLAALFASMP
jgi:hypothetical protein